MNHTSAIRTEGLSLYERTAAIVCRPGTPKKTMDSLVAKAWGNVAVWRARACRLGEAGAFSAAAIRQIQVEYARFMEAEGRRLAHERALEAAKRPAATCENVTLGRAEFEAILTRISALERAVRR